VGDVVRCWRCHTSKESSRLSINNKIGVGKSPYHSLISRFGIKRVLLSATSWNAVTNRHRLLDVKVLMRPYTAYVAACLIAATCFYGWTYEIVPYGGDLAHYGPLARLSGLLSSPVTGGLNFLPPQNPTVTVLLVWLLWFVPLRLFVAVVHKLHHRSAGTQQVVRQ
jgi:hypothetical protein